MSDESETPLKWLSEKEEEIATASIGQGQTAINEAKCAAMECANEILMFGKTAKKREENSNKSSLSFVQGLSEMRISTLNNIMKIAELETEVCNLSGEFDRRAVHLVTVAETTKLDPSESLSKTSQSNYTATKKNWDWIKTVLKCAEIHRQNAADYHQFFYDVDKTLYWMKTELPAHEISFNLNTSPEKEEFYHEIKSKLKELSARYIRWSSEIHRIFQRSCLIVPVPCRVLELEKPRPVIALSNYKTEEIEFLEGDTLLLIDNSDKNRWKVTNVFGLTSYVQSVLILIPPLFEDAVESAVKLQLEFNSLWTRTVKNVRNQLIQFILTLFKEWSDDEMDQFHHMTKKDKRILLRNLETIESIFLEILGDCEALHKLQEYIFQLRTIIEESRDDVTKDSLFFETILMQFQNTLDITVIFQSFWAEWVAFKEKLERFQDPSFFTNESVYTFLSSARFKSFLAKYLTSRQTLPPLRMPSGANSESEDVISPGSQVQLTMEHTDIEKEEIKTSSYEETYRYILNAAIDPRDNSEISIQAAKERGLLNEELSCYTNLLTKEKMSIAEAVQKNLLVGKLVSHRREGEKKKSYGIIVVKSFEETSQYSIQFVIDPSTGEKIDEPEARRRKIIDEYGISYKLKDGRKIPVSAAIAEGLVIQENSDNIVKGSTKVVSTTYIVTGVVDQKRRSKISIEEGIKQGILDRETNEYVNNVTGQRYGVQEAIKRGFIKGRLCKDPSKLEFDPENSLVISKFKKAKTNLMRSLHVISAFKSAKH